MKKKIAIIGGSYLQLPIVKKAKEMEIEVHCFAWEDGSVCKNVSDFFYPISIIEKENILEVCKSIGIHGVTSIASDTAVITVNYVAQKMGLISNNDKYTLETTNKYHMRKRLTSQGIPSPKYFISEGEIPNEILRCNYPLIVKPTDRSGSRGVEKVYHYSKLQSAIMRACKESFQGKAIIEEFIEGREISIETISYKGNHFLLQFTDKVTTGEPYFVETEHHQPSNLSERLKNKLKYIVFEALNALHIEYGAAHSELKITNDEEVFIIEIGARMGGDFIGSDLVRLSTGYDFVKGIIDVALGDFKEPIFTQSMHSGVYFLSKETKFLKTIIENYKLYSEIVEAQITDNNLRSIKCSGDRSGYLIYQSNSRFKQMNN